MRRNISRLFLATVILWQHISVAVAFVTPRHLPVVDLEYAVHQATLSVRNNPTGVINDLNLHRQRKLATTITSPIFAMAM